jgi:hypothetical protein
MTKQPVKAIEMSRRCRERVSRKISSMTPQQMVAYFRQFESVDVLKAKVPSKSKTLA